MKHICVVSFFRHDIHSFFLSVDVWLQFQFHWPVHFIATIFNIIWSGSSAFLLMINRRILISAFFFFHRCLGPEFKLWRQRIMIIWEEEFHEMRSNRLRKEKKNQLQNDAEFGVRLRLKCVTIYFNQKTEIFKLSTHFTVRNIWNVNGSTNNSTIASEKAISNVIIMKIFGWPANA